MGTHPPSQQFGLEGGPERQVESAQPAARHSGVDTEQGQTDGVAERSATSSR